MNVLDLFSGIGGFSLGLERAGMRTVAFCEINPFCRRVLAKHWTSRACYYDVKTLTAEKLAANAHSGDIQIDVVAGGPPCQRTSVAAAIQGVRTGETLWPEMCRLIEEIRPHWAIIEQPAGNKKWEGQVADDLARIGYEHARLKFEARACGAPHQRRRVFFVANPMRERCAEVARIAGSSAAETLAWPAPPRGAWQSPGAGNRRMDDGLSDWVDRLRALGNAVVPQITETIGRAIMTASAHKSPTEPPQTAER